jgi:Mg2+-importing ATPase
MDIAVINYFDEKEKKLPFKEVIKVDEIPFDFSRRRLTVVVNADNHQWMITKGAVEEMEEICSHVMLDGEVQPLTDTLKKRLRQVNRRLNEEGMRVLTVAVKKDAHQEAIYSVADEQEMTLIGFMGFLDPAKESAVTAIKSLHHHGVAVKVLTGDNEVVAEKVCRDVGIEVSHALLGADIDSMSAEELAEAAETTNLFAKLNPMQKSRIIQALQAEGHTVGFMGDGINDAPALRTADVGISVDTAADITKDASSIILLEKSLNVLDKGVSEGRKVFSNMMKYIKITISSNFGNVFSILVASAFLPFLPMLSIQLLVQNLIYDMAQLTIPWDSVDEEEIAKPVKWQVGGLLKFTLCIGPVSSVFDILTFLMMWYIIGANTIADQAVFQTGWFVVGLVTQTLVVHIVRTKKVPFIQSRASFPVIIASLIAILAGILLVLSPMKEYFSFTDLPAKYWLGFICITITYLLSVEIAKRFYIRLTKEWL